MFLLMLSLTVVLVIVVFFFARNSVYEVEQQLGGEINLVNGQGQKLLVDKENIMKERKKVEKKEVDIFMLYDITKEIAKKNNVREAFEIFKDKLRENVSFEECLLLDFPSREYDEIIKAESHFLLALKEKRKEIGYLALSGLPEEGKEKALILANQFALVLRRIHLYQEIEDLATTDSLTNIYTRRYFLQRFSEELKRSKKRKIEFSFLMIDVDHFKKFNDRYGHLTGDQILREVASIIKANVREIDIAGRYGGEEFCVVLPDTDKDGATFAAERIRIAIESTPIKAYDMIANTTLSIGIATFPKNGHSVDELIDKADWALYRAKKSGRNRICVFGAYKKE